MPRRRKDAHLFELAKRGAEVRVRELAQEIKTLFALFPRLRDSFDRDEMPMSFLIAKGAGRVMRPNAAESPRRRRRMSAAARRKISAAQKKRWAVLRKEAKA